MEDQNVQNRPEFVVPEDLISLYSETVLITHTLNEFYISFFQIQPPTRELAEGEQVKARCISRIILSAAHFHQFASYVNQQAQEHGKEIVAATGGQTVQ